MANLKDLKLQINSVGSTKKITSAMKMVAASKLRRSQEKAESLNAVFNWSKTPEVPGVAHDHTAMALDALQYILQE